MKVKLNEAVIMWKRKKNDVSKIVDSSKSAAVVVWGELKKSEYKRYLDNKECAFVFYLDRKNEITGFSLLSVGALACCIIDTKEVIRNCLLTFSSSFMLVHNHPSGNLTPSKPDEAITKRIKEAAAIMDLNLLDHIILDFETGLHYSFLDNGKI